MKVAETGDVARLYNVIEDETFVGDVVKVTDTDVAVKWRKTGAVERFPRYIRSSITFSEPVTHHVTRYSNEISCGATGPVRVEYTARKVTCPDCRDADYRKLVDRAHEEALDDNAAFDQALIDNASGEAPEPGSRTAGAGEGRIVLDDGTDFTYFDGSGYHAIPGPRCDVGGTHWYPDLAGPAVYKPPCTQPPTHRYRSPGMVDGHRGHRCAQHVAWLDRDICTVEPLVDPAALCLRAGGDHWPHMAAVSPDCRTLPTDQQ